MALVSFPFDVVRAINLGMGWAADLMVGDIFLGASPAARVQLEAVGLIGTGLDRGKEETLVHAFITGALVVLDSVAKVHVKDMDVYGKGISLPVIVKLEGDYRKQAMETWGAVRQAVEKEKG